MPATPASESAPFNEDDERFVAELTAHQAAIQAFIQSLMPGDPACDDVVQRTNITLWRKRETFTLGTNFRAWAFEVAKWNVRSHFKDLGRKHWLVFDDGLTEAVSDRMSELTETRDDDRQAALRECLAKLRRIDRELLISHYEVGETLAECAARTGRSRNGLKVTLFRLRAALRGCIAARLGLERIQS